MRIIKKTTWLVFALLMMLSVVSTMPGALAAGGAIRTSVSAGSAHSLVIDANGTLWAWGDNSQGQLGDNTLISRRTPVRIMDNIVMVSAGDRYNLAIREDGSLWAWGQNDRGQLGDGTTVNKRAPVRIMEDVIYVAAGWKRTEDGLAGGGPTPPIWLHSLAITSDGSLWAWGDNISGQLGDETTTSRHAPVRVMDDVISVSAGNMFTMVIRSDNSLWAWGQNDRGQFGNGTTTNSRRPIKIMDDVAAVYAGDSYAMVIKTDGTLWAMGQNDRGQFGNGNRVSSRDPLKLKDDVQTIAVSGNHTLAIKTDGSLWVWGQNDRGQFGNGATINSNIPIRVAEGIAEIAAGDKHTLAVKDDGSLWAWGLNHRGQLGDGSNINRFSPVRIMDDVRIGAEPAAPGTQGDEISVFADGERLAFDAGLNPMLHHSGTVLVPMRAIFTALGAEVNWNQQTQTVTAVRGNITVSMRASSDVLIRNGEEIPLGVPLTFVGSSTFVPIRAVAESFNALVNWDSATQTVRIYS
ncbi:MAG: stalk domain-containing protein [Oscillospiraceae bacterium]|nr:stalk domain-containing protein [Oscillospiraceae bacterium]